MKTKDMGAFCDVLKATAILKGEWSGISLISTADTARLGQEILLDILGAINVNELKKIQKKVVARILDLKGGV